MRQHIIYAPAVHGAHQERCKAKVTNVAKVTNGAKVTNVAKVN